MTNPQAETARPSSLKLIIFVLPALAILIGLGTWQVQRLAWKEDLLAKIDARIHQAPVTLAQLLEIAPGDETLSAREYVPVEVTGTFDQGYEFHFFATWNGRPGYQVLTVLEIAEGSAVIVNRGFVPFDLKQLSARPDTRVDGPVTIIGLAREPLEAKPSWIVPENDVAGNVYYWKDWKQFVASAGGPSKRFAPIIIDAGLPQQSYPPGNYPVPGQTIIELPNNHLQYAVTWYGLAFVLVIIVVVYIRRTRA